MDLPRLGTRGARVLLAVLSGILLASCTDQQPAGPTARRDGEAVERWEAHGSFDLPELPGGGGSPLTSTGIRLAEGQRARILVAGALALILNPSYPGVCGIADDPPSPAWQWGPFCPTGGPYVGRSYGPRGAPELDDALWVQVYIKRPDGQLQRVAYGVAGDPFYPEVTGPGTVYVMRTGISEDYSWKGVPVWNTTGKEAVFVETLAPDSTPCGGALSRGGSGARLACTPLPAADSNKLKLRCPASVERAQTATCTVSAGASVPTSVAWTFVDSLGHTAHDSTGAMQWGGTMVVGGVMQVSATVDGNSQTDSARIAVVARHWPRIRVVPVDMGNFDLPAPAAVQSYPQLAHSVLEVPAFGSYPLKSINNGPNAGYWYVTTPFQQLKILVSLNYAAFAPGSAWYRLQTGGVHLDPVTNRPTLGRYCNSGDLPTVWRLAREHEGIDFFPDSHVQVYQDWFRHNSPEKAWEKVVIHSADISPGFTEQNSAMTEYGNAIWNPSRYDPDQNHTTDSIPGRVPPAAFPCYLRPMS